MTNAMESPCNLRIWTMPDSLDTIPFHGGGSLTHNVFLPRRAALSAMAWRYSMHTLIHSCSERPQSMKVLIVDKLSPETVTALEKLKVQVEVRSDLNADSLPGALADVNVLVVRSTKVTAASIQAAPQLSLVIRAGAGVDTIDLAAASARGIYVANCPGKNTAAVAELAIGLLIAADRRIVDATVAMRDGNWRKKEFGKSRGLACRTLGVLGLGAIGKAVAQRAKGLDMEVIAWSRSLTPEAAEEMGLGYAASPEALAAACDAVSIHLASTPDTKHLVGKKFLDAMKPGSILINTSRGTLVDTAALRAAIGEKGLRVGLDVFEGEPAGGEAPWTDKELAAVATCTPHIGASTDQASEAVAAEVVRIVEAFLRTGHPVGTVNLCAKSSATFRLVLRHFNRVGVLAFVLDGLREEGINVEETENTIFAGAEAACCSMLLDQSPSEKLLAALRTNENILNVILNACE
jgi:D-3-phosphoglycerate dehydrogenase / 2-oxoglutarate reductase